MNTLRSAISVLRAARWQLQALLSVLLVAVPSALISIALPTLKLRRRFARRTARAALRLAGVQLITTGLDRFPVGPCVIVANHASYLDGVVLMAVLPPRFTFLIKAEMQRVPVAGLLLQRLGMAFVSRTNARATSTAARRMMRAAHDGKAIGVFPEGTFHRQPGIRAFHLGAFATAAYARIPIAPIVIEGTRFILHASRRRWCPQPVRINLLTAIITEKPGRQGANWLREKARAAILSNCNEPDAS